MSLADIRTATGDSGGASVEVASGEGPRPHILYAPLKRAMDVVASVALLVVGAPVFLVITLGLIVEARGPILYRGWRVGQRGRPIRILKFRTMRPDSEELLATLLRDPELAAEFQATFKLKEDPRCTRFGRMLRRTSLDELPQLWNVLIGDMSLVGPRPIVEDELPRYRAIPGGETAYLTVKPGLTGVWQVSGRSDTTYEERVLLDIDYFRTRGLVRDIGIMARTPRAALGGHGAY